GGSSTTQKEPTVKGHSDSPTTQKEPVEKESRIPLTGVLTYNNKFGLRCSIRISSEQKLKIRSAIIEYSRKDRPFYVKLLNSTSTVSVGNTSLCEGQSILIFDSDKINIDGTAYRLDMI